MISALPILGICAAGSNAGKTTLITQLIPALKKHEVSVSVIKHAHHQFDIDYPGKDSYVIRESGAAQTLIASSKRWALMTEFSNTAAQQTTVALPALIKQIDSAHTDLIIAEGFKSADIAKIEVYRPSLGLPLLANNDSNIIAVASDGVVDTDRPVLPLNNIAEIAAYILKQYNLK